MLFVSARASRAMGLDVMMKVRLCWEGGSHEPIYFAVCLGITDGGVESSLTLYRKQWLMGELSVFSSGAKWNA